MSANCIGRKSAHISNQSLTVVRNYCLGIEQEKKSWEKIICFGKSSIFNILVIMQNSVNEFGKCWMGRWLVASTSLNTGAVKKTASILTNILSRIRLSNQEMGSRFTGLSALVASSTFNHSLCTFQQEYVILICLTFLTFGKDLFQVFVGRLF